MGDEAHGQEGRQCHESVQAMEETDENGVSAETPVGNSHKEAGPACGSQAGLGAMEAVFYLDRW